MSDTATYFNLAIGAPARLAAMRQAFKAHAQRFPHCPDTMIPRRVFDVRGTTYADYANYCGAGLHNGSDQWYSHDGEQFRNERDCHDVYSGIGHTGWFTDTDQSERAIGIVASLPHGRFIAGYRWTSNDERVYFSGIHDDETDAARMADEHARVFGESAMEDSEHFEAAQDLQTHIEEMQTRLRECIALRHRKCMQYARDEIAELIEGIRADRDLLASDYKRYV